MAARGNPLESTIHQNYTIASSIEYNICCPAARKILASPGSERRDYLQLSLARLCLIMATGDLPPAVYQRQVAVLPACPTIANTKT